VLDADLIVVLCVTGPSEVVEDIDDGAAVSSAGHEECGDGGFGGVGVVYAEWVVMVNRAFGFEAVR
jgi:hypothetical protein